MRRDGEIDLPEHDERKEHDERGRERVAESAQRAAVDLIQHTECVEWCAHAQKKSAIVQDIRIPVENSNHLRGQQFKRQHKDCVPDESQLKRGRYAFFDARKILCAVILSHERRHAQRDALNGKQRHLVDFVETRPARHTGRAESVDISLHEHVGERRNRHLNAAGKPLFQYAPQRIRMDFQLAKSDFVDFVGANHHPQHEHHGNRLRTNRRSGDLIGWASDEYLLFGEDAEAMADDVGNQIVTIETEILRVRDEPNTDAEVVGLLTGDDELEIIEFVDDGWISVEYEEETRYVSSEFVSVDFHIDEGETLAAIKKREEEERQAKLTANQGAVVVGGDDLRLLAALIQCEAGSETYNGKLAVGAVVMNRVRSGAYPNTISGVIFASGQFTPALNGKVARVYTSGNIMDSCYEAAQAAINGETNVGGATHFRRAGNHDGLLIDHQVFW